MREKKVLAWHFVRDDRRLGYDATDLVVEPGYVYSVDKDTTPTLCQAGLHGSLTVFDALQYAPGSYLCRVAMWGDLQYGDDKLTARHREVLAAKDVSAELRLWGCWCVRQVWHLVTDDRSSKAVKIAEAYAVGEATYEELEAARAAAEAAAWEAAGEAAGAAARAAAGAAAGAAARAAAGEAARAAAGEAAGAAAWEAARAAAWEAAGEAAGAAARAAAWKSAGAAAREAQKAELERRMIALLG